MSWHVTTCHDMSWHGMTCHDMLWHVMTCRGMSWHVMTCHDMSYDVVTCRDMSWHVIWCHGAAVSLDELLSCLLRKLLQFGSNLGPAWYYFPLIRLSVFLLHRHYFEVGLVSMQHSFRKLPQKGASWRRWGQLVAWPHALYAKGGQCMLGGSPC